MSRARIGLAFAVALGAVLSATGCKPVPAAQSYPSVEPRTTAPPGAVSEYVEDAPNLRRSIRLTEGVAMALECRDSKGAPCPLGGSAMLDDGVASYRVAYGDLDQTVAYGRRSSTQVAYLNRSLFVVVAHHAGNTTLSLQTGEVPIVIDIEVFPAK